MRALILGVLILAAGCDSTTPELKAPGKYTLSRFNGESVEGQAYRVEWTDGFGAVNDYWIVRGSILLNPNGEYVDSLVIIGEVGDPEIAISHRGTWAADGEGSERAVSFTRNGFGEACDGTLTHAGLACVTSRGEGLYVRHE